MDGSSLDDWKPSEKKHEIIQSEWRKRKNSKKKISCPVGMIRIKLKFFSKKAILIRKL